MGKLYFNNRFNKDILIAENISTDKEITDHIKAYIFKVNPHYKIYYFRTWTSSDGVRWYDVGSHTEFFKYIEE